VFIKAHLNFKLDDQDFEYIHQTISVFGVTGLPWGRLDPKTHFGRETRATLRILAPTPVDIRTPVYVMRESTVAGEQMGLKFLLSPEDRKTLSTLIRNHGFYPTAYLRKYPRIPADPSIQTFPMRVVATDNQEALVLDVSNLIPNGLLLSTENRLALSMKPGQRLDLTIEPRGWFPHPIRVQGLICRIVDELHPESGNLIRYFGISFTKVDELNRAAFFDLLKDILSKIKPLR